MVIMLPIDRHEEITPSGGHGEFKSHRSHQHINRSHLELIGFSEESDTINLSDIFVALCDELLRLIYG